MQNDKINMFGLEQVNEVIENSSGRVPIKYDWQSIAVELATQILNHDDVHYPTLQAAKLVLAVNAKEKEWTEVDATTKGFRYLKEDE